jgi:hypothetical protein
VEPPLACPLGAAVNQDGRASALHAPNGVAQGGVLCATQLCVQSHIGEAGMASVGYVVPGMQSTEQSIATPVPQLYVGVWQVTHGPTARSTSTGRWLSVITGHQSQPAAISRLPTASCFTGVEFVTARPVDIDFSIAAACSRLLGTIRCTGVCGASEMKLGTQSAMSVGHAPVLYGTDTAYASAAQGMLRTIASEWPLLGLSALDSSSAYASASSQGTAGVALTQRLLPSAAASVPGTPAPCTKGGLYVLSGGLGSLGLLLAQWVASWQLDHLRLLSCRSTCVSVTNDTVPASSVLHIFVQGDHLMTFCVPCDALGSNLINQVAKRLSVERDHIWLSHKTKVIRPDARLELHQVKDGDTFVALLRMVGGGISDFTALVGRDAKKRRRCDCVGFGVQRGLLNKKTMSMDMSALSIRAMNACHFELENCVNYAVMLINQIVAERPLTLQFAFESHTPLFKAECVAQRAAKRKTQHGEQAGRGTCMAIQGLLRLYVRRMCQTWRDQGVTTWDVDAPFEIDQMMIPQMRTIKRVGDEITVSLQRDTDLFASSLPEGRGLIDYDPRDGSMWLVSVEHILGGFIDVVRRKLADPAGTLLVAAIASGLDYSTRCPGHGPAAILTAIRELYDRKSLITVSAVLDRLESTTPGMTSETKEKHLVEWSKCIDIFTGAIPTVVRKDAESGWIYVLARVNQHDSSGPMDYTVNPSAEEVKRVKDLYGEKEGYEFGLALPPTPSLKYINDPAAIPAWFDVEELSRLELDSEAVRQAASEDLDGAAKLKAERKQETAEHNKAQKKANKAKEEEDTANEEEAKKKTETEAFCEKACTVAEDEGTKRNKKLARRGG